MIQLHPKLISIFNDLNSSGFQPLLVGGYVRDSLLGVEPKDIDVEVIGCTINQLEEIISWHGKVDSIGKSFGILKFKSGNIDVDFSVPRKENKIGTNHRDFKVLLEPMTAKEAAERRDFSWNSLAFDPIKNELLDFFNGKEDLNNRILRHTSDKFTEDPLRIFRAMQFQSRFGMTIHPDTFLKMDSMNSDIKDLSKERISEEFMKWAIKGNHPELIFDFIDRSSIGWFLPELAILKNIPQDHIFHPEGTVDIHTKLCLKHIIKICERENITGEDKAVLVFTILLHDIGKAITTESIFVEKHKRIVIASRNHEEAGAELALIVLQRIGIKQSLIDRIIPLIRHHLAHINLLGVKSEKGKITSLLKLSRKLKPSTIKELLFVIEADHFGRGILNENVAKEINFLDNAKKEIEDILKLATSLNVVNNERTTILMGRHLIELGFTPSIFFGEILRKANDAQDNLEFTDIEEAKEWVMKNFKS